MKKIAACMVIGFGFSGPAFAADLPVHIAAKLPSIASHNWSGFYAGLNVGYGWQDPTVSLTPNDIVAADFTFGGLFGGTAIPSASYDIKGMLGGAQAGYNWQLNRNLLVGVEAEFNRANVKGEAGSNFLFGAIPPTASNMTAAQNVDWFGTVRARVGWLPTDTLLLYATGGLAYGNVKENVAINNPNGTANGANTTSPVSFACFDFAATSCFTGSSSHFAAGWTVGAGAEYEIWRNITLKVEYLYVDLGTTDLNVVAKSTINPGTLPTSFTAHFSDLTFSVARVGLNYRF